MGCAMCFASCTAAPSAKHLTQQPAPNLQRRSGSWNSHLTLRPQEPSPFGRKLWFLLITVLIHIYLIFYADRNISICISVGHIFAKGDWDNNDGELVLVIQQGLQHIVKHFADFFLFVSGIFLGRSQISRHSIHWCCSLGGHKIPPHLQV